MKLKTIALVLGMFVSSVAMAETFNCAVINNDKEEVLGQFVVDTKGENAEFVVLGENIVSLCVGSTSDDETNLVCGVVEASESEIPSLRFGDVFAANDGLISLGLVREDSERLVTVTRVDQLKATFVTACVKS